MKRIAGIHDIDCMNSKGSRAAQLPVGKARSVMHCLSQRTDIAAALRNSFHARYLPLACSAANWTEGKKPNNSAEVPELGFENPCQGLKICEKAQEAYGPFGTGSITFQS